MLADLSRECSSNPTPRCGGGRVGATRVPDGKIQPEAAGWPITYEQPSYKVPRGRGCVIASLWCWRLDPDRRASQVRRVAILVGPRSFCS